MSPVPIARSASATVPGMRRPSNQDRYLIFAAGSEDDVTVVLVQPDLHDTGGS